MPTAIQKLHSWLNDRTQREQVILALAALFIIFWLWDSLLAHPLRQKQDKLQTEIINTQTVVDELQAQIQALDIANDQANNPQQQQLHTQLTRQMTLIDQALSQYKQQLIPPPQILTALQSILKASQNLYLVRLENLPVTVVSKDNANTHETIFAHTFIIELRGNYFATLSYLQQLEALPWYLYWDDFNYQVINYPEARIIIKLHILSDQEKLINV